MSTSKPSPSGQQQPTQPFVTKAGKFFEALKEKKLVGTKCRKCGTNYFPPRVDCSKDFSEDMEWVEYSGEGELVTYTVNTTPPESFSKYGTYIIGIVKLIEGPAVMTWLKDIKPEEVKVGMKLKVEFVESSEMGTKYNFVRSD
nr:Zn-ribbon domain-containing OB-fold protein [Candidatus Njordarchaeota archaeon]